MLPVFWQVWQRWQMNRGDGRHGVKSEQVPAQDRLSLLLGVFTLPGYGCVFHSKENKTTNLKKVNPPSCSLDYLQIPKIWKQPKWPLIVAVQQQNVMPNSLRLHALQHARLCFSPPSPRACSNSCPLSRWCHPTILSSFLPFSSIFTFSQNQGFFQWVGSSHQVAKVL